MSDVLTIDDFSRVPWGGVARNIDGSQALRVPESADDVACWLVFSKGRMVWLTDMHMADTKGWVLDTTDNEELGRANRKRDALVKQVRELQDAIVRRNERIEELEKKLKSGIFVSSSREALKAAWDLAYDPEGRVIPKDAECIERHAQGTGDDVDVNYVVPVRSSWDRRARVATYKGSMEVRLLDPPAPNSGPWEEASQVIVDVYCGGPMVLFRSTVEDDVRWVSGTDSYSRDEVAAMNPRPFNGGSSQSD